MPLKSGHTQIGYRNMQYFALKNWKSHLSKLEFREMWTTEELYI